MKPYHFEIETPMGWLSFWVAAISRAEAVEKANADFQDPSEGSKVWLGLNINQPIFMVKETFRVEESHITEEGLPLALPETALRELNVRGYENGGSSNGLEQWREQLQQTDEASWTKGFIAGHGPTAGIYGVMTIRAYPHFGRGWSFTISAFLYPVGQADGLDGEWGGVRYKVELRAAQEEINDANFPEMLDAYEEKFSKLIYSLRQTDPVHGLALTDQEMKEGHIQGFFSTREELFTNPVDA